MNKEKTLIEKKIIIQHSTWKRDVLKVQDVGEAINNEYDLLISYIRGEITWLVMMNKRNKLFGEFE